jgi:predicted esterase YcpF (UPF0227 family)
MAAISPITHLLYLHGFRSSPKSTKAQHMASVMAAQFGQVHWWCPQLPPSPKAAAELILEGTRDWPAATSAVMGSSLGGFYATWLAAQLEIRAVLINPAVFPARDLAKHIGEQTTWQAPEERFYFAPEFVTELTALEVGALENPQRVLAFIAKGDEVLDWREMSGRYPNSQQVVLEGGDHALSDFEQHVPQVLQFLQLTAG